MKIEWNRVTWYSKLLAVIVGLATIALGFYFTNQYQEIKRASVASTNAPVGSLVQTDIENVSFSFGENQLDTQDLVFKNGKSNFEFFMGKSTGVGEDVPNTKGFADISNIHITDIDRDGNQDAVAVLAINYGGTGYFKYLVFFINVMGKPVYKGFTSLGDRIIVNSIKIDKGIFTLDMTVHGPTEPLCCPNTSKTMMLKFENDRLVEIKDDVSAVDTSNWKTYKNEKYGFEFLYPPEKVSVGKSKDRNVHFIVKSGQLFVLDIFDDSNKMTPSFSSELEEVKFKFHISADWEDITQYSKITINGNTAYKIQAYAQGLSDQGKCQYERIVLKKSDKWYQFSTHVCDGNISESLETFETIVSTLKFTE